MKPSLSAAAPIVDAADSPVPRTRRRALVGAGVAVGAALAVASLARRAAPGESADAAKTDAAPGGGYRLTEHIRRYYETTRT